jgi:rhamnulokinase
LIAIDLGSSGGRVYLGGLAGDRLTSRQIHRFPNGPVRIGERWYWDILRILDEVETGLRLAAEEAGERPLTIGIDSFGVDYCLIDGAGALMASPRHMRDPRTRGLFSEVYKLVPREWLYQRTGAMEIEINTLLQLIAERAEQPWLQANASSLLFVPDFVAWVLSGRRVSELTIASTSQLVDPMTRSWAADVAERLAIPRRLLNPLVEPGTIIGPVLPALTAALGLPAGSAVVAAASHDTSAAIAAAPIEPGGTAFISLGTWSLLGLELSRPVLSNAALRENFTNECGAGGRIVFHKILIGLWLLQECRRRWVVERPALDYDAIHAAAAAEEPLRFVFDPADPRFVAPDDMLAALVSWFTERERTAPKTVGEVASAIYDSLALSYRGAVEALEEVVGSPVRAIHVVGGGARAPALCQATANATGRPVLAGPAEAAVTGNMICQLIARGRLSGLEEGRALVRRSTHMESYVPAAVEAWDRAWRLLQQSSER